MRQLKGNGHRTAGQIIAEKLKGKTKPSERIPVLEKLVEKHRNGDASRMDIFVQATSMLAEERGKARGASAREPMSEGIMGDLVAGIALSGTGGC